ncbi:hypothetical protein ACFW53_05560 [Nocardiopsis dassonvillei]|uniref:hypothetical protein n=1 Tax=Nocardiopsis dassonvillei TaxID=2014 RepID=UPI00366C666F
MSFRPSRPPEPPRSDEPALAALGALVDRSVIQIAEAARDARTFDRETVRAVSDLWDNAVTPLFRAATGRTGPERERRARAALEWTALLRPTRWDWMVEQAALCGHRLDALVQPPPVYFDRPYRDYRGEVRPAYSRWTPQALAALADDYALGAASLRHVRIEREGARLCGFLTLEPARSYDPGDGAPGRPPTLDVHLEDLTEVDVDSDSAHGVRLDSDADGVVVGLGAGGVLRARAGSLRLDDGSWHLSGAGRRADARTPPRDDGFRPARPPQKGKVEGSAWGAATFLRWAMLMIRRVRYPGEVARVPVGAYCRALEGAGRDVLAAGALSPRRREAAFRSLTAEWLRRGGTELAADWKLLLRGVPDAGDLARGVRDELLARGETPPVSVAPEEVTDFPERAPLRMVSYTAEHTDGRVRREAGAMVHLAVPGQDGDGPWRMRVLTATDPVRLRGRTPAFDGTGRARVDRDGGGREVFAVDGDALCLDARAWAQETPPR